MAMCWSSFLDQFLVIYLQININLSGIPCGNVETFANTYMMNDVTTRGLVICVLYVENAESPNIVQLFLLFHFILIHVLPCDAPCTLLFLLLFGGNFKYFGPNLEKKSRGGGFITAACN